MKHLLPGNTPALFLLCILVIGNPADHTLDAQSVEPLNLPHILQQLPGEGLETGLSIFPGSELLTPGNSAALYRGEGQEFLRALTAAPWSMQRQMGDLREIAGMELQDVIAVLRIETARTANIPPGLTPDISLRRLYGPPHVMTLTLHYESGSPGTADGGEGSPAASLEWFATPQAGAGLLPEVGGQEFRPDAAALPGAPFLNWFGPGAPFSPDSLVRDRGAAGSTDAATLPGPAAGRRIRDLLEYVSFASDGRLLEHRSYEYAADGSLLMLKIENESGARVSYFFEADEGMGLRERLLDDSGQQLSLRRFDEAGRLVLSLGQATGAGDSSRSSIRYTPEGGREELRIQAGDTELRRYDEDDLLRYIRMEAANGSLREEFLEYNQDGRLTSQEIRGPLGVETIEYRYEDGELSRMEKSLNGRLQSIFEQEGPAASETFYLRGQAVLRILYEDGQRIAEEELTGERVIRRREYSPATNQEAASGVSQDE